MPFTEQQLARINIRRENNLDQLRSEMELSQPRLARILEVHVNTVIAWETGLRRIPKGSKFKLAALHKLLTENETFFMQPDESLRRRVNESLGLVEPANHHGPGRPKTPKPFEPATGFPPHGETYYRTFSPPDERGPVVRINAAWDDPALQNMLFCLYRREETDPTKGSLNDRPLGIHIVRDGQLQFTGWHRDEKHKGETWGQAPPPLRSGVASPLPADDPYIAALAAEKSAAEKAAAAHARDQQQFDEWAARSTLGDEHKEWMAADRGLTFTPTQPKPKPKPKPKPDDLPTAGPDDSITE